MNHPPPRIPDHVVLSSFGIGPDALLGGGGEAAVYAIDEDRVLRLPRTDVAQSALDARRDLIGASRAEAPFELPEVLEHVDVDGRTVVVERRLPGRSALDVLGEPGTDREALVRSHLDAAAAIADLPCPTSTFGEVWGAGAIEAGAFVAVAYLAPEITPTATEADQAVARTWAEERDLLHAVAPAERWIAPYWTGAVDDEHLRRWCDRILECPS